MTPVALTSDPVAGALLAGAVDYAGLFPPASLGLSTTLTNYLDYRDSPEEWALGRLVIPVNRLADLASLLPYPESRPGALVVSVLLGTGTPEEASVYQTFHADLHRNGAVLGGAEVAPGVTPNAHLASGADCYCEIPVDQVSEATLAPVEAVSGSVKLRTGGVTAAAFPSAGALARALALLGNRRIAFKATAGLHHPLRGSYRLTYSPGAPTGVMFGYLNVMMASLLAWGREPVSEIESALLISHPGAIAADSRGLGFLGRHYTIPQLEEMRRNFFHSFGSCSFREPMDEWPLPEVR